VVQRAHLNRPIIGGKQAVKARLVLLSRAHGPLTELDAIPTELA
jgi:hypothetical protein